MIACSRLYPYATLLVQPSQWGLSSFSREDAPCWAQTKGVHGDYPQKLCGLAQFFCNRNPGTAQQTQATTTSITTSLPANSPARRWTNSRDGTYGSRA